MAEAKKARAVGFNHGCGEFPEAKPLIITANFRETNCYKKTGD